MGCSVTLRVYERGECPHCGGVVRGLLFDEVSDGGSHWRPILDKLGYGDEQYGQEMELTEEQVKTLVIGEALCAEWDKTDAQKLGYAIVTGRFVAIEADW